METTATIKPLVCQHCGQPITGQLSARAVRGRSLPDGSRPCYHYHCYGAHLSERTQSLAELETAYIVAHQECEIAQQVMQAAANRHAERIRARAAVHAELEAARKAAREQVNPDCDCYSAEVHWRRLTQGTCSGPFRLA